MDTSSNEYDPMPHGKPIICLDFDGCIHSYSSGWKGSNIIPDPPVPGVFEWLERALKTFEIHIYSSRSLAPEGREAMWAYIKKHGGPSIAGQLVFSVTKPRAFLTIDDRCVCFNGDWNDPSFDPQLLEVFVPWYRYQK
jgi:hypothetical protein